MNTLQTLKTKGYRITLPRKHILEILYTNLASAEEIFDTLHHKKIKIDLASVYRTLQLFSKENIIEEVEFGDGKKRYEMVDKKNHHHHAVCKTCGDVADIIFDNETILLHEVLKQSNFQIEKHSLEFFGLCANCQ